MRTTLPSTRSRLAGCEIRNVRGGGKRRLSLTFELFYTTLDDTHVLLYQRTCKGRNERVHQRTKRTSRADWDLLKSDQQLRTLGQPHPNETKRSCDTPLLLSHQADFFDFFFFFSPSAGVPTSPPSAMLFLFVPLLFFSFSPPPSALAFALLFAPSIAWSIPP
jgi:hypothetical protein